MKNLSLIFLLLFTGLSVSASNSAIPSNYTTYNDSFIFTEGGVEFAVYPNGEFDFYFNPDFRRGNSVHISSPNVNISYNSGYNYEPYVQYDDYGAVIQIENVPVYYDYYGRIIQAGDVYMRYNNFGRLARVGNLRLHYNAHHHFTHHTGFINHYNRRYVYRPWHDYYRRPNVNVSIVFGRPYRAYYEPQRISYTKYVTVYNNYYVNNKRKRNFYRPSQEVHSYNYGRRTSTQRNIAQVRTRSNSSVGKKGYSTRSRSRIESQRSDNRGNKVAKRSGTYSDRAERSTNSRGKSSAGNLSQESNRTFRSGSTKTSPGRTASKVESRTSERLARPSSGRNRAVNSNKPRPQRSATGASTRTIEKSSQNSARKPVIKRQTRQANSSVRIRSNTGTTRDQTVRSKNSSRSRSSARNVDNKI